jgi:hypothetical protein
VIHDRPLSALGLLLAAVILASESTALAENEGEEPVTAVPNYVESPQRFAFELRMGPYLPEVDANLGATACGSGPYAATFGTDAKFYAELEFDYQALDIYVGTLAVGAAVGIFHASANAFERDSCERSEDTTDLWILPVSLLAVVRFDIFAERWSVPLVPFFKVGFTYAVWWTTNENGTSEIDGDRGYGGTAGMRIGGGLMLRLDWMERRAARTFDNEFGVNHSYIFFEYYWAWLDGFGSEERMNVGDDTWVLGIALEF